MKIKKVGKLLKKLNNLYDNVKEEGSISRIEKDLFLNYIKELYEHAIEEGSETDAEPLPPAPSLTAKPVNAAPVTTEASSTPSAQTEVASPEPSAKVPSTNTETSTAATDDTHKESADAKDTSEEATTIATTDKGTDLHDGIADDNGAPPIAKPAIAVMTEEMQELFTIDGVKEVSDRLGMQPIQDMNRCMGINERIFTIRELFGGDDTLFKQTMDHLNTLADFEAAKDYLANGIAVEQEWTEVNKSKKASNFIKLVYRRYLN